MYTRKVAFERLTFCDPPNTPSILCSHEYPCSQNKRVETDLARMAMCGVWRALNSSLRL